MPARDIALDVLDGCLGLKPRPAESLFEAHAGLKKLDTRDRAFARLLYMTCLRRMNALDKALSVHIAKTPKSLTLLNVLRLGAAQLLVLGTPAHAAVKETVTLARKRVPHGAKMVNAVLRRLSDDPLENVAETPPWLAASWSDAFGELESRGIESAHGREPPLDLTCPADRDRWARMLDGEPIGTQTIRLKRHGAIPDLPGYDEGAWWVQDAAAAALVPLLGDLRDCRVLDIGAAPGGKTAQLCAAGARVTALESVEKRAGRLRENMTRLRFSPEIVVDDVTRWTAGKPFDAILLDAPCTATGTIRRHPDILRTRRPGDPKRMSRIQRQMIEAALRQLAPGGRFLYAVCSMQPEEGPEQFAWVTSRHHDMRPVPINPATSGDLPVRLAGTGAMRTSPADLAGRGGMDGFFAALLQRES
ncbi:MAG: hypothetical protein KDG54_03385 [Geminicoccaceae bacterium]|nr:hypothetical protein [Geminicoccaceae bacterium]